MRPTEWTRDHGTTNAPGAFEEAELLTDPAQRARAFAEVNKMITALAPAVPYVWDKQANVRSEDVNGVINQSNAIWDLTFTSLKK